MNAEAIAEAVGDMDSLDPQDRRRVEYFTRQIVDMFAPTNFLGTNPDALERGERRSHSPTSAMKASGKVLMTDLPSGTRVTWSSATSAIIRYLSVMSSLTLRSNFSSLKRFSYSALVQSGGASAPNAAAICR